MRVGVSLALGAQRVPPSGGGGGWPSVLATNLLCLYDAKRSPPTVVGGFVTAWADLSGNGYDLAHEELSWPNPTFTETGFAGGPAVVFPAGSVASDPLSRASVPADYTGGRTMALVYQPQSPAVGYSAVFVHADGSNIGFGMRDDHGSNLSVVANNAAGYGDPQTRALAGPQSPHVVVATIGPSVAKYERNGVDVTTLTATGTGSSITGKLSIGHRPEIANRSPAAVGFAAIWTEVLTAEKKAALLSYLASVWAT